MCRKIVENDDIAGLDRFVVECEVLAEGAVGVSAVTPDKYGGRVVADGCEQLARLGSLHREHRARVSFGELPAFDHREDIVGEFEEPQLATLVDEVPAGNSWIHEYKYDGYRLRVERAGDRVRLFTRYGSGAAALAEDAKLLLK